MKVRKYILKNLNKVSVFQKNSKYRVVLLCNGEYRGTLKRSKVRKNIFGKFREVLAANKVIFPKRFINTNEIKSAKFELAITKVYEPHDTYRLLRGDDGKVYAEKPLGDWTILNTAPYEIEEHFWVFGYPRKGGKRPDITEIVKIMLKNKDKVNPIRQMIVLTNKLIIYNEEVFDMVICKNAKESQRLYLALRKIATQFDIRDIMFSGYVNKNMQAKLYKMIIQRTGWTEAKVRRTTTRP